MENVKTIIAAAEESFLERVLVKKTNEAGIPCEYVRWRVDDLIQKLEGVELITLLIDDGNRPPDSVIHYLYEHLSEESKQIILIGEENDLRFMHDNVPGDLIYKSFERPMDNAEYIGVVKDFFRKMEEGEFRKSILVVDDDPNYLNLVRDWLKSTYKVTMVNSGLQAIKYLGKNKVDLILLDHEMPVTTGPQVLEMLRSDDETKDIPVMFLTGKSDKESVMAVVALKPEGYFLKTIEKEDLLKNLAAYFDKKKS